MPQRAQASTRQGARASKPSQRPAKPTRKATRRAPSARKAAVRKATQPRSVPRNGRNGRGGRDGGTRKSSAQDVPPLHDPENFMASIQAKARLLRDGHTAGAAGATPGLKAAGLLFSGMGFSGMVANVVKDAATRSMAIPCTIVKHYQFPNHVQKGWHTLAITYSGDTEETLSVVRTSLERGVPVTGFSTGGKLAGVVGRVIPQPPGYQPRAAFGYTWFSVLGFLEGSGVLADRVPVAAAIAAVADVDRMCGPAVPEAKNPAKQLARALAKPIPQIYATPAFYGVGLHFRGMLNENAKKIAKVDLVPESNHNDLTGWGGDSENRRHFSVVAVRHANQNQELQKRLAFMEERYRAWGVPWTNHVSAPIETFAEHVVEQARAIQFFDYTSVYVAALRGKDPADIREIKALKKLLREKRID